LIGKRQESKSLSGGFFFGAPLTGHFRYWHDPAHVLVGIFASRQPKLFGAFLTQKRPSGINPINGRRSGARDTRAAR
jgi:hypothetical protein